ncbi:hypothetical protein FQN57_003773 [Myotisia sp. PD_48]|nr:hypothetical protein FQN57_003773 [Myotisia sp. PD_48]
MAGSFRDLIEHLLAEITLRGEQGASPSDVLNFIDSYYNTIIPHGKTPGNRAPNIDRCFKSKVWTWLTRHPEVFVGKDREGNSLTLDEVQPISSLAQGQHGSDEGETATQSVIDPALTRQKDHLNVFVSADRMWLAIAGHEPDTSRVSAFEFVLLSIIASRKGDGVIQSELERLSGQDKRSIPKRTDCLRDKGYIEKRAIQYNATRTSLCTLAKFARLPPANLSYVPSSAEEISSTPRNTVIDFSTMLQTLFDLLKQYNVISRNDLKEKMNMKQRWRSQILARAIRKLEAIGCLRRVKAVSQYSEQMKSLHSSIMLVREPTEKDIKMFHEDSKSLLSSIERGDVGSADAEADADDDQETDIVVDPALTADSSNKNYVVDAGRAVPQWTPDRILANQVFDAVDRAGKSGIKNLDIAISTLGSFYKRPTENIVSRLTDAWRQHSQPLHLRHLSLIRDTALRGTNYYYIHYSFQNFEALVHSGQASWEAFDITPNSGAKREPVAQLVERKPGLDEFGFPINEASQNILKHGDATITECLTVMKPPRYFLTLNDPIAVEYTNGSRCVEFFRKMPVKNIINHTRDSGVVILDGAQSRHTSSPNPVQITGENLADAEERPRKRQKASFGQSENLTEKERLEALGMDESWTEYSLLLMERPGPGLYITPYGKRRPVGKARGRPGKSRIAVFKLPALSELDWFVPEEELEPAKSQMKTDSIPVISQNIETSGTRKSTRARPIPTAPTVEIDEESVPDSGQEEYDVDIPGTHAIPEPTTAPSIKRPYSTVEAPTDQAIALPHARRRRGRPPKKRKLNSLAIESINSSEQSPQEPDAEANTKFSREPGQQKEAENVRALPPSGTASSLGEFEVDLPVETSPRASIPTSPAVLVGDSAPINGLAGMKNESIQLEAEDSINTEPGYVNGETGTPPVLAQIGSQATTAQPIESTPNVDTKRKRPLKRDLRSGSVGILRRKIIMDILDKAGGLYPMGTELWYPFTTSWLNPNQTEKPDMRTIKNAVRSLVETGKLRQHTFSGKNSKGLMVTKSILTHAHLAPNDPRIVSLQKAMLDADPHSYFPPEVEIDGELRKSTRQPRFDTKLPRIDGEVKVMLHHPPSRALMQEARTQQNKRLKLLRKRQPTGHPSKRLRRLERIQKLAKDRFLRHPTQAAPSLGETSVLRSLVPGILVPPALELTVSRRDEPKTSLLMMLMCPTQTFFALTGTFGTITRTHLIPYEEVERHELPNDLGDIFLRTGRRQIDPSKVSDPASMQFFYDVELVNHWELDNLYIFDTPNDRFRFINYTIEGPFESVPLEGVIGFYSDMLPAQPARRLTRRMAKFQMLGPMTIPSADSNQTLQELQGHETVRKLARLEQPRGSEIIESAIATPETRRKVRKIVAFPRQDIQKLIIAMVVIRTIAGGMEGKVVEWAILAPLFPNYDPKFIHERGKSLGARHRLEMAKMQSEFQERFAEAYENNEVPPLDFDHLESYDWAWVIEWTARNIERPRMGKLPDLPATRKQFDSVFEIRKDPSQDIDVIYQHNTATTLPRKRSLLASVPFSISLSEDHKKPQVRSTGAELLEVAKTWVRANVITPEDVYRPVEAGKTIGRFSEEVLGQAIRSLVFERVISLNSKGRVFPGRNYDLTETFLFTLTRRRSIESTQLRQASYFKTQILDPALRSEGKYYLKAEADDGDILAMINLSAHGRVKIKPKNPPRNKYGLTEGGYMTRFMDKNKLRFDVEIRPVVGRYVYGNPIEESVRNTPVPKGELDDSIAPSAMLVLPMIPVWLDVHAQFIKLMWDLAACAILGIIAARPALSVTEISQMIEPCLAEWEADLMLRWMADVGIIENFDGSDVPAKSKTRWKVTEWWWMVLGHQEPV